MEGASVVLYGKWFEKMTVHIVNDWVQYDPDNGMIRFFSVKLSLYEEGVLFLSPGAECPEYIEFKDLQEIVREWERVDVTEQVRLSPFAACLLFLLDKFTFADFYGSRFDKYGQFWIYGIDHDYDDPDGRRHIPIITVSAFQEMPILIVK